VRRDEVVEWRSPDRSEGFDGGGVPIDRAEGWFGFVLDAELHDPGDILAVQTDITVSAVAATFAR
jgi:hypothetical protein